MILKENIVYFEDADSYEEVHEYFSKLFQAQSEFENKKYGAKVNDSNKIDLETAIKAISTLNFKNDKDKKIILELLEKEAKGLDNDYDILYYKHFYGFLALLDFITRKNIAHSFEYEIYHDVDANHCVGSFKGIFEKELNSIEDVMSLNPVSFNIYDQSQKKTKKTLPYLSMEDGFEEIVKKIKRHFISNMDKAEYSTMFRKYKKFVEKLKCQKEI